MNTTKTVRVAAVFDLTLYDGPLIDDVTLQEVMFDELDGTVTEIYANDDEDREAQYSVELVEAISVPSKWLPSAHV